MNPTQPKLTPRRCVYCVHHAVGDVFDGPLVNQHLCHHPEAPRSLVTDRPIATCQGMRSRTGQPLHDALANASTQALDLDPEASPFYCGVRGQYFEPIGGVAAEVAA